MQYLFETPIKTKKVNKNATAYQYKNGMINIENEKFILYSMTEAIKEYRRKFKNTNRA